MVEFVGPPAGATRNKPISGELRSILEAAAQEVGVDLVRITSGGQPGTHGKRTGSTRHDGGRAADVQLVVNGSTKTFTDSGGGKVVENFVKAVAARGCTGIGAGVGYMGNRTLHVGFGRNASDTQQLVWGAGGKSANAPSWLKAAADAGWATPVPLPALAPVSEDLPALFRVVARSGLKLRAGPGLDYCVADILPSGTLVTVAGFDGPEGEWARVDLEDDGRIDGHMFAAFLERTHLVTESVVEDHVEAD
ncbi:MAG: SH3 domain-containing protein [Pseudomonadota bacterium]